MCSCEYGTEPSGSIKCRNFLTTSATTIFSGKNYCMKLLFNMYGLSANDLSILHQRGNAFRVYLGGTLVQISAGTLDIQTEVLQISSVPPDKWWNSTLIRP
jgi:hypothetical protein